jgi:hypothetical protein
MAASVPALAQANPSDSSSFDMSEIHGTIGVRMWRVDWQSWFFPANPTYHNADLETAVIPVGSLRYKDFLVSGSYLLSKDFQFNPAPDYPTTERREYDVNLGYFVVPGLAVSLGWKDVKYDTSDGGYTWHLKGPTLGLSGSAPLAPWSSLYGSLAYGRPKLKDNAVFNDVRANYLLTELGLAFPLGHFSDSLHGFVVTAGYRYQRIGAKSNVAGATSDELFENTQGAVLGISYSM